MVISDTKFAQVTYLEEVGILSICWYRNPTMEQFTHLYLQGLQFVKENPGIRFYSTDISRIGPFDAEQESWLSRLYYPQVSEIIGEVIYAAVVFSENHFQALVNNYVASHIVPLSDFIQFNYFTNSDEALDWLRYMQKGQDLVLAAKS
jgi:hypothetical protein